MSALEKEVEAIVIRVLREQSPAPVAERRQSEISTSTQAEIAVFQLISNKPNLTKAELAIYFGVAERSIEEWIARPQDKNPLPAGRVGRDLRFNRKKVDEWMEREGERYWRLKNLKTAV